ncbi:hypothetical protein [Citrobacter freundii]|uniref:hypothetical protein n=1 Tax=Citrobacter freundii TaxID=546 RepID=UPI0024C105F7|nr:hypothetical protein [Citrobacter freundii]WHW83767.1 hypothetical protein PXV97_07130 [Citrobacter freundii]WHW93612.1 hypothetical protein P0S03_07040 [Citrobacter freundii]
MAKEAVARISENVNEDGIEASMIYAEIISTVSIILTTIGIPASGYFSYKYAIQGERRKEWNLLATPIRDKLIAQIDAIERDEYLYVEIKRGDILKFADLKNSKEREILLAAFEGFEKAHSFEELWEVSGGRQMVTGDTSQALSASKKLLTFIERK